MKALVWSGPDRVELSDRAPKPPGPQEAQVRVKAAGISAADLGLIGGRFPFARPSRILGHEISGVVEASPLKEWVGRRVVVDPALGCGRCASCKAGRKALCEKGGELGTTQGDGGFAEYVTVPVANLQVLPDAVAFEAGALLEPLCGAIGAFERLPSRPGETVLVFGSGTAGLLFVQLARLREAKMILLVGGGRARLALAPTLGATYAWSHESGFLQDLVLSYTLGLGPDLAIEASGADGAVTQAFSWVRRGGRVLLFGLSGAFAKNLSSDTIVTRDLTVGTGIGTPSQWGRAIELGSGGKVDLASLVTHRFPLEEADRALAAARDVDSSVKVVLTP